HVDARHRCRRSVRCGLRRPAVRPPGPTDHRAAARPAGRGLAGPRGGGGDRALQPGRSGRVGGTRHRSVRASLWRDGPLVRSETVPRVVGPGSIDPVTYGHLDTIERSSSLFDEVTAAVLINEAKVSLLRVEARMELLREVTAEYPN